MKRPFCIGLTGGVGAGKSAVATFFSELGAEVIDTDVIARVLVGPDGPALPRIKAVFGADICLPDGQLDRHRLRELIFSDTQARKRLESILHPLIFQRAREQMGVSKAVYVVVVVPLLCETGGAYREIIDRVAVVDCDESMQIERCMLRDGITRELAEGMMAAQASRKDRLAMADDVIDNRGDLSALRRQVHALHDEYLKMTS